MIIRDSSRYFNPKYSDLSKIDGDVRIGIIRSSEYDSESDCFFYMVEVTHAVTKYMLKCRQMTKFGDVYNFEEWGFRSVDVTTPSPKPYVYEKRIGEVVIVAHIGGNPHDGIILGTMKHPARKTKIKPNTLEYISEFNGLMTHIAEDGSYKVTFQGKSLTSDSLKLGSVGNSIPESKYNSIISGTYISIDNTGSIDLNDAGALPQYVKIDKSGGKISITSGSIFIDLDRNSNKISINSIDTEIEASNSFKLNSLNANINSTLDLKIKSAKIAIGYDGVELIDSIIQIVDAIGSLIVSSPVGPCSPIKTAPTWANLEIIKTKLSAIKGSL